MRRKLSRGLIMARPVVERIMEKVVIDQETNYWVWTACKNKLGYGSIIIGSRSDGTRKSKRVYRALYECLFGKIQDGLVLDHLCRNPSCVNPNHLEPVTQKENILRGNSPQAVNARKNLCKDGHPLDGLQKSGRFCKQCARVSRRESMRRKRRREKCLL